jgi:dihydrofolate synthase/folylpolyglutamate synthase
MIPGIGDSNHDCGAAGAGADLSYQQALAFWYGCINYEQRVPQPADLKLDRMRALLALLGNPQQRLRIVHIAGSKGKGSTAAMLEAILRQAGYRTGLFTSPHLCRVEERIQVNGQAISAEELASLLLEVQSIVQGAERGAQCVERKKKRRSTACAPRSALCAPTFFEVATAVGFLHFVRRRV